MNHLFPFQQNKLLSELSTFGIGGPARLFIEAKEIRFLRELIVYCYREKLPYIILGKGSNCLFSDRGFNGLVILNKVAFLEQKGAEVYVGAGYSFSLLGVQMARKGWSGLEFASGIPATVGGAIYMNAGAGGPETKDFLTEVTYITEEGELLHLPKDKLQFSYRTSPFQGKKGAIAAARFELTPLPEARQKQLEIVAYRTRTQPYGDKSAGCIFRNPPGGSAGALIEKCGLKGAQVGGAEISSLHANFIVNKNGASAQDVLSLASHVKESVKERADIDLEMEIRVIPYDV